jgi:D-alanyl-lipoteichoic acid acyltransferase DltB (MBOAT superfamily)
MNFSSVDYAIFLFVVFVFYWFVVKNNIKAQNVLLLISSYYFYAQWDYRFPLLLLFSTFFNFVIGKKINEARDNAGRRFWLYSGVALNVGVLVAFKFSGFLLNSISITFPVLSVFNDATISKVVLPVGISFYTFCGLSYIIDVFRNKMTPSKDYVEYSVFISFFPALLAGPIERYSHFLPQIQKARKFNNDQVVDGLKQILWGLFKKIVIADGCAGFVNMIFNNVASYSGSTLALGIILFSFQIYADFSGYSDIALGTARLLGIELLQNFAFPYFSRDIAEFWRRWHISLSSWFRDYVFYPLERRRLPFLGQGLNTMIVFLLTGLWHGANWTFIMWGGLNGLYLLLFKFFNKGGKTMGIAAQGKDFSSIKEIFQTGFTFGLTTFAWIFFRAENLNQALVYISGIFSRSLFMIPKILPLKILVLVAVFVFFEWLGREQRYAIAQFATNWPRPFRWAFYYIAIFVIFYFSGTQQQFIYSQF